MHYLNDNDTKVSRWGAELVNQGHLPNAEISADDIRNITPSSLDRFGQCHFFSGILGWPYALRLAGWNPRRQVWTGSCPCQPFSSAGAGKGVDDSRHLWPAFRWLIAQCRPSVIFGEQVASSDGRFWLDGVRADLEAMGYAIGAADLCAAGIGPPHIRQRLFWVAYTKGERLTPTRRSRPISSEASERTRLLRSEQCATDVGGTGAIFGQSPWSDFAIIQCSDNKHRRIPATDGQIEPAFFPLANGIPARVVRLRGYGNAIVPSLAAVFIQMFMEFIGQ